LKLETEDLGEKKKSEEWKLLLKIFRKFGSQISNKQTHEEVIEDHSVIVLDSFNDYDFYSEEEINNMPLDIGSHPNIENEEIIILETNAEVLGRECEENTLLLLLIIIPPKYLLPNVILTLAYSTLLRFLLYLM
jgi:hypothetical protein